MRFPSVSQGYSVSLAVLSLRVLKAYFLITCQATSAFSPPPTADLLSLFHDVVRLPVPSTVHMWDSLEAEAKMVEGGRQRTYPLNYRDSLNKKKGIFSTVVFLQFWGGKGGPIFTVRD